MPRYDLKCINCKKIYRDCILTMNEPKQVQCKCGSMAYHFFDQESIPQIPEIKIESYYDTSLGRYIRPSEIKEICKREGKVWGDTKEIEQEQDKNKAYIEQKQNQDIEKSCEKMAHKIYAKNKTDISVRE